MRWLFAVLGGLLLTPFAPAQEAAQKLFETMEQKLKEAKAYQFDFELHVGEKSELAKGKGTFLLAVDNRLKFTFAGTLDGKPAKNLLVSDGKKLGSQGEFDGKPQASTSKTVSAKLSTGATFILGRAGLFAILGAVTNAQDPKGSGEWKLSGFKTIGPEKVGDRDTQIIAYQILPPEEKAAWTCKLWLDTQTGLPLKRVLEVATDGKLSLRVTETYTPWVLDPKLPEGTFMLPK
jgi:outer membrane lipoprotein-sorting protein